VLGGPGAGKGTQSEKIVDNYKCIHLSVGELLRDERQRGDKSPHAELIESCLVAGKIVPVEISLNLLRNAMDSACQDAKIGKGNSYGAPIFLVDGFPRNFDNLSGWTREMPEYAAVIGSLVYDCPIDILEQRILSRAETSGRSDDNLESARKRFQTFQRQTMPVVRALEEVERMEIEEQGMGKIHVQHISGQGTVDEVWDATEAAMNDFIRNDVLTANALLINAIDERDVSIYRELCSNEFLKSDEDDSAIEKKFQEYELLDADSKSEISNASFEVQDGTKVVVTYDRHMMDKNGKIIAEFRESRVWSHESKGWTCIHFVRKPLSEA
jgi:UMP-CMP kinase